MHKLTSIEYRVEVDGINFPIYHSASKVAERIGRRLADYLFEPGFMR